MTHRFKEQQRISTGPDGYRDGRIQPVKNVAAAALLHATSKDSAVRFVMAGVS